MDYEKNLAALCQATALMIAGIPAHSEILAKRGLDADFLTGLETDYGQLLTSFNELKASKARMMEQAEIKRPLQNNVTVKYREVRKTVKLALLKETWREFGIMDER